MVFAVAAAAVGTDCAYDLHPERGRCGQFGHGHSMEYPAGMICLNAGDQPLPGWRCTHTELRNRTIPLIWEGNRPMQMPWGTTALTSVTSASLAAERNHASKQGSSLRRAYTL